MKYHFLGNCPIYITVSIIQTPKSRLNDHSFQVVTMINKITNLDEFLPQFHEKVYVLARYVSEHYLEGF